MRDVDHQTELAHKVTEEAIKKRIGLNEEIENLQDEIARNERDALRADEYVKQYTSAKEFFDQVKALKVVDEEAAASSELGFGKSSTNLIKNVG